MNCKETSGDGTMDYIFGSSIEQFTAKLMCTQHNGTKQKYTPQKPPRGCDSGGSGGVFYKNRRQRDTNDTDHDHDEWIFLKEFHCNSTHFLVS